LYKICTTSNYIYPKLFTSFKKRFIDRSRVTHLKKSVDVAKPCNVSVGLLKGIEIKTKDFISKSGCPPEASKASGLRTPKRVQRIKRVAYQNKTQSYAFKKASFYLFLLYKFCTVMV